MPIPSRKTLVSVATVAALAAGGAAFAGAATTTTPSSSSSSSGERSQRPAQKALTGDTADKVRAAALAKAPGGTVLRVEDGGPSGSPYHAHVRRSDGSEVVVLVNSGFDATAVQTGRHGGHRRRGGRRHEALTGATATKVKAAALDKLPGATVLRSEQGGPGNAAYHAHVRTSEGSEVVVRVDSDFKATSVQTGPAGGHGPHGDHGPGGRGDDKRP